MVFYLIFLKVFFSKVAEVTKLAFEAVTQKLFYFLKTKFLYNIFFIISPIPALTLRGDTNVIMVDAQRLEAGPWYIKAAENTWYIGKIGAQFVDYLVSR